MQWKPLHCNLKKESRFYRCNLIGIRAFCFTIEVVPLKLLQVISTMDISNDISESWVGSITQLDKTCNDKDLF